MKVVILAGGFGSRLSEETNIKPKPMVEVGGKPILWHIMKLYSSYGFNDFVVCCGYKGYLIKEYFMNYYNHACDFTVNLSTGNTKIHKSISEPWNVTLVDTGINTMTGGRIKNIEKYINNEPFLLTYGDGLSDININEVIKKHNRCKSTVTVTAVKPEGRFGALNINEGSKVESFMEKPAGDGNWINGGFFVCEPEVFKYINGDATIFEQEPLKRLASEGKLDAYMHTGFWKPMDTLRDKIELEKMWQSGHAPWKTWNEE